MLKTTDDWIRFQHWRGTPRTRSAGRRTPFQQAILVAWAKGLPGFPIRRGRGRGGTGPTLADIARTLTEAGVPEVTRKVIEKARANEADPTGTVTTLADCDRCNPGLSGRPPAARSHPIGARGGAENTPRRDPK